nr:pectin acetylesterase 8-like [Ipomoea batatas]
MATIAAVILLLGFILTPLQANNVSISWVQNATDKGAELRWDVLAALPKALPLFRGMWITNCIAHHLIYFSTLKITGNKTYAEVFYDWYFDYNYLQVIDTTLEPRDCSEYGIYPQALN